MCAGTFYLDKRAGLEASPGCLLSLVLAPQPQVVLAFLPSSLHTTQSTRHNKEGTITSLFFTSCIFLRQPVRWTRAGSLAARASRPVKARSNTRQSKEEERLMHGVCGQGSSPTECLPFQRPAPHSPVLDYAAEPVGGDCRLLWFLEDG